MVTKTIQDVDLILVFTLSMEYMSLSDLLRLRWISRDLRDQVDQHLDAIKNQIPWRIAVDYSQDFCKVYVTYGWTNFIDMEVTSEASDYHCDVESVTWRGHGGNNGAIIRQTLFSGKEIVVNLDPLTMHPYGLNQEKWGMATRISLGHGTMYSYHVRAPDRERSVITYSEERPSNDHISHYKALKFQSISKDTRRGYKILHKDFKKSRKTRKRYQSISSIHYRT